MGTHEITTTEPGPFTGQAAGTGSVIVDESRLVTALQVTVNAGSGTRLSFDCSE